MNTVMLIIIAISIGVGMLAIDNYFEKKENNFFNSFLKLTSWGFCSLIFFLMAF